MYTYVYIRTYVHAHIIIIIIIINARKVRTSVLCYKAKETFKLKKNSFVFYRIESVEGVEEIL
jgi:hypothetical protein